MIVTRAEVHALRIPFRFSVSHAAATHRYSDAVLVVLSTACGLRGHGEALARPYVTGETSKGLYHRLAGTVLPAVVGREVPLSVSGGPLLRWVHGLLDEVLAEGEIPDVVAENAARCATELAVVDLYLRARREPLSALLPPRRSVVRYSGIIPGLGLDRSARLAGMLRRLGFRDVKAKLSPGEGPERLDAIRAALGEGVSLRVDANGGLAMEEAEERAAQCARLGVDALEEPTARSASPGWGRLVRRARPGGGPGTLIMADESAVTLDDARRLHAAGAVGALNLRLAKLGGILPTLRMAAFAESAGLAYQVGCLVGETAVLSAAGRAVAAHLRAPRWVEGSYGRWLMRGDVGDGRVGLGWGGRGALARGAGLGVRVSDDDVARFSMRSTAVRA